MEPELDQNQEVGVVAPQPIRMLSPSVIHRIAAGEIIDRPASVLKELLENSIDAKSTKLRVSLMDAGLKQIQVEDNGWGLSHADLLVCLQRHATSKIVSEEDLDRVFTLGFRGEALAAASSVSRFELETLRRENTTHGNSAWRLESVGGMPPEIRPSPRREPGTKVSVKDLFFNIPARLKFLKKPGSELAECIEVLKSMALTHPGIEFEWSAIDSKGELKIHQKYESQSPTDRFCSIYGIEGDIFEVNEKNISPEILKLRILAFKPPVSATHQKDIKLSVNGRWVSEKRLPFALREAYAGYIEVGRYPRAWVDIEVDPSTIDVNIHPQKKEIRWPTGFSVAGIAYQSLRNLITEPNLESSRSTSSANLQLDNTVYPNHELGHSYPKNTSFFESVNPSGNWTQTLKSLSHRTAFCESKPPFEFKDLKVVGEIGAAWIVCEAPEGLVLIDQHAAHERVEFEKIMKNKNWLRTKPLMLPLEIDLPPTLSGREADLKKALKDLGFEFSEEPSLKKDRIEIIAIPECDRSIEIGDLLSEVFDELIQDEGQKNFVANIQSRIAASLACHGSVRRGQRLPKEQIKSLLEQMSQIPWGGFCPHGRPLWRLLSHLEIEGFFHR